MSDYISVSVLNGYIKGSLDAEDMLHNICVAGEISGLKCSGAHAYFNIKDSYAQIAGCLFNYRGAGYMPKDGETVLAYGSVDYYSPYGKLSYKVRKFEPLGEGALALKLELLRKKLLQEGYFDTANKIAVPKFCRNVCVLTARTGAVIRDIITTCRKKNTLLNIDVFPIKVQGIGCAESVINALKIADSMDYDAIIIARGGGSLEDLMGFNDEKLVHAVAAAATPIISAVGHETDTTLCDLAADVRVPTPTAAGELVAFDTQAVINYIIACAAAYRKSLLNKLEVNRRNFFGTARRITHAGAMNIVKNRSKIGTISVRMVNSLRAKALGAQMQIRHVSARIQANSPIKILSQGYYRVYHNNVDIDVNKLVRGDEITVHGVDSRISAQVINVEKV